MSEDQALLVILALFNLPVWALLLYASWWPDWRVNRLRRANGKPPLGARQETRTKPNGGLVPRSHRDTAYERYGERHQAERAKYAETIRLYGGQCMERVCIMPSRRIPPGAYWHLSHDHERGGPKDYLGPAHPECNEAEARGRGVIWEESDPRGLDRDPGASSATSDPWVSEPDQSVNDPWSASGRDEPPF